MKFEMRPRESEKAVSVASISSAIGVELITLLAAQRDNILIIDESASVEEIESRLSLNFALLSLFRNGSSIFEITVDISNLPRFLKHQNPKIRWLALQCLRVFCSLPDSRFETLVDQLIGKELTKLRHRYRKLFTTQYHQSSKLFQQIITRYQSTLVNIYGIPLVRYGEDSEKIKSTINDFVVVPSIQENITAIANSLSNNRPVVIEGPLGCSKTSTIEYIAALTGRFPPNELIKIQVGNQIDSKILIGMHCCTEIPGEFVWKAGPLTEALTRGAWLLLEDIDFASADVLTILMAVIKSRSLKALPGCYALKTNVDPRFRLIITRRVSDSGQSDAISHADREMILKLCDRIIINPMSREEIGQIVIAKWPQLETFVSRVLNIYAAFTNKSVFYENGESYVADNSVRKVSLRDLFKWCHRISAYFKHYTNEETRKHCLLDANDCFLQSIPSKKNRLLGIQPIGVQLNIARLNAENLCDEKPEVKISANHVEIGRSKLTKRKCLNDLNARSGRFSRTHQSLLLLERIACCVQQEEPVLLVGETGTGKTTTVQYLSHLLGRKLTVVNLNQQSDTCDLLGGYKPVDLKILLEPVYREFKALFLKTFPIDVNTEPSAKKRKPEKPDGTVENKSNEKLLSNVEALYSRGNLKALISIMCQISAIGAKGKSKRVKSSYDRDEIIACWYELRKKVDSLSGKKALFAFNYVEGSLVKAMVNGDWILLVFSKRNRYCLINVL